MKTVLRGYVSKSRSILRDTLLALLPDQGSYATEIQGISLHRFNDDEQPRAMIYNPILVVVVQGRKWVKIGTQEFIYGDHSCFVAGIDMPVFCCVKEASTEKPYLALTMDLDHGLLTKLMALNRPDAGCGGFIPTGALVRRIDNEMLDACLRLISLLARPEQIPFLAPLFRAEIHYRLLLGLFGRQLRSLYTAGSLGSRMISAINWLRQNYKHHLHVETLAEQVNMATSTFHKNFKSVTTLSPLQYQKRLRLSEAQRLMLVDALKVTDAAFAVGYKSLIRFSREYRRLYGTQPEKDVARIL